MPIVPIILLLVIPIVTSIWVYFDAKHIGVRKGQAKGILDMSPLGWSICCLGIWIIAFPLYVGMRGEFNRLNRTKND
jgi:hypothetical protein